MRSWRNRWVTECSPHTPLCFVPGSEARFDLGALTAIGLPLRACERLTAVRRTAGSQGAVPGESGLQSSPLCRSWGPRPAACPSAVLVLSTPLYWGW